MPEGVENRGYGSGYSRPIRRGNLRQRRELSKRGSRHSPDAKRIWCILVTWRSHCIVAKLFKILQHKFQCSNFIYICIHGTCSYTHKLHKCRTLCQWYHTRSINSSKAKVVDQVGSIASTQSQLGVARAPTVPPLPAPLNHTLIHRRSHPKERDRNYFCLTYCYCL